MENQLKINGLDRCIEVMPNGFPEYLTFHC